MSKTTGRVRGASGRGAGIQALPSDWEGFKHTETMGKHPSAPKRLLLAVVKRMDTLARQAYGHPGPSSRAHMGGCPT
eukprot:353311-Chlamydomonas_euryale.AAC.5